MSAEIKDQSTEYRLSPQQTTNVDGNVSETTDLTTCSAYFHDSFANSERFSWHEHVYKKLNNKPTPHYIENILGLGNLNSQTHAQNSYNNHRAMNNSEVIEPLNLSVKCEATIITKVPKGKFLLSSLEIVRHGVFYR